MSQDLNISVNKIKSFVLGGHGDTMVAMLNHTFIENKPLSSLIESGKITKEQVDKIVDRTKKGGAEIVKFLEKGSAFYAPASAGVEMAESYLKNLKRELPCAAHLNGEYGVKNLYAGVPVIIGSKGVEKVVELKLKVKRKKTSISQLKQFKNCSKLQKNR